MPEALVSHALGIRHWSSYTILGCTYRLRVEVNTLVRTAREFGSTPK